MKTVEITLTDDGEILVGLKPEGADAEMMADDSHLSPAQSIEDALEVAKNLLVGDFEEEANMQAEEDMTAGFEKIRKPKRMDDYEEEDFKGSY